MSYLDNTKLQINDFISNFSTILLKHPNIVGVGRGTKVINGKRLNIPTLTIFVERKLNSDTLSSNLLIPQSIMGIHTDVLEIQQLNFATAIDSKPACGGGCLITERITPEGTNKVIATLSYAVTDRKKRESLLFLASEHFLDKYGQSKPGQKIYYKTNRAPEYNEFLLGLFYKGIPLKKGLITNIDDYNVIDAGLGYIGPNNAKNKELISATLLKGSPLKGVTTVEPGEEVYKIGTITHKTSGEVLSVKTTAISEDIYFKDQIMTDIRSLSGDSGSIGVVSKNNKAFGLLSSASMIRTSFNTISNVLNLLDIELL